MYKEYFYRLLGELIYVQGYSLDEILDMINVRNPDTREYIRMEFEDEDEEEE